MKRVLVFLCLLPVLLTGCTSGGESAAVRLDCLIKVCPELPTGQIYDSQAEEGMVSYLNASLKKSLYGERAEEILALTESYAIYLSSQPLPCEIAVFRCYSRTDAHRVTAMCLERAEAIRVAIRETPYVERMDWIRVLTKDRTVIMTVTPDPERMEEEALRQMK
ncbi:MAG: hypothetical protein IJY47_06450 [Clostridia bacterium]|nr:hypothetical protein [Clostridia bacterium]